MGDNFKTNITKLEREPLFKKTFLRKIVFTEKNEDISLME